MTAEKPGNLDGQLIRPPCDEGAPLGTGLDGEPRLHGGAAFGTSLGCHLDTQFDFCLRFTCVDVCQSIIVSDIDVSEQQAEADHDE